MNNKLVWMLTTVFMLTSAPVLADFSAAMQNFQSENYPVAYEEFMRMATLGHKDSQFNLGAMHYRGQGADKDIVDAYAWISLSAELNDDGRKALAERLLAKMSDTERAAAHERADELMTRYGEDALLAELAPVYAENAKSKYDLEPLDKKAPDYPSGAARIGLSGSVDVEFSVDANGYVKNYFILASTNKAFNRAVLDAVKRWRYHPVQKEGESLGVTGVRNRIHFRMPGDAFNEKKLKEYVDDLRYRAEGGLAADMFSYAYIAEMIPEIEMPKDEAIRWYFKAAQAGLPQAQYQVGLNLIYGRGCEVDSVKGLKWLTRAANANLAPAQTFLASELISGQHFSSDPAQAREWLELAVKTEYPEAMVKKAWLLATSKDEGHRDGKQALALINAIVDDYPDQFTAYQTLAASQAEAGDFSAAQKTQKKVIKMANSLGFSLEPDKQRLLAYQKDTAWRE